MLGTVRRNSEEDVYLRLVVRGHLLVVLIVHSDALEGGLEVGNFSHAAGMPKDNARMNEGTRRSSTGRRSIRDQLKPVVSMLSAMSCVAWVMMLGWEAGKRSCRPVSDKQAPLLW